MLLDAPRTARDYLALEGIVVNGHVGRNVARVQWDGTTAYLKREHRVRWRDRWRQWRAGFGWVSLSLREAQLLRELRACGIPVPNVIASGEADGQAFVLLEGIEGVVELQHCTHLSTDFGTRLGIALARLHQAGFHQPDLFAKHFLVDPTTEEFVLIDWQRAIRLRHVPLSHCCRALATLRATAFDVPPSWWSALLHAYQRAASVPFERDELAHHIETIAMALRQRPKIQKQRRHRANVEQHLVRIEGETVNTIPELAEMLRSPNAIADLYEPGQAGLHVIGAYTAVLTSSRYRRPCTWWATLRGKAWRAEELRAARVLFHLERVGIPAPKMLAYGQRLSPHVEAFLLYQAPSAPAISLADREVVQTFAESLLDAGGVLDDRSAIGIQGGHVHVVNPFAVRLVRKLSTRAKQVYLRRVARWFEDAR